jgi:hypothetical protein
MFAFVLAIHVFLFQVVCEFPEQKLNKMCSVNCISMVGGLVNILIGRRSCGSSKVNCTFKIPVHPGPSERPVT